MAISGTSYSTISSSYLSVTDTNKRRQEENLQNSNLSLNNNESFNREPSEYVFRGELLDEAAKNNGFREKRDQSIDPINQVAINNYDANSKSTDEAIFLQTQGSILDAYV